MSDVRALPARLGRALAERGVGGTLRAVGTRLLPQRRSSVELIWYSLDLQADRPRRELGPGLELRQGSLGDLPLLAQMPHDESVSDLTEALVRARVQDEGTLWLVTEGDRTAFSCFIFRGHAPVHSRRGGTPAMPPDTVCLEDSISSPAFRGRGIAPAAWSAIADHYAREGIRSIVTKVDVRNVASCRAVEKAGFVETARMRWVSRDWRTISQVAFPPGPRRHGWLVALDDS